MKNKLFILVIFIITVASSLTAQTIEDAVRYSTLFPGSTARTQGVGGSFGAMGGDFGVLSINPAGLADYRTNELIFSLAFNAGTTTSTLSGNDQDTKHLAEPSIEALGLVFTKNKDYGALVTSNFAIGLHQYNAFNQRFAYSGTSQGTIVDRFKLLANTLGPDQLDDFEAGLAFSTGAIYDFDSDLLYESDIQSEDEVSKSQDVSRSGRINEATFAWAGKFRNAFNLGVSVGVPFISFEEDKEYFENDIQDQIKFFDRLAFRERLSTSGVGINLKVGAGYTLAKVIRLGLAYQSPTIFKLDDNFDTNFSYAYTENGVSESFEFGSPDGRFDYRLRTPSRVTGSAGALINLDKVKGFINADATYVNYKGNKFNLTAFSEDPDEIFYENELNTNVSTDLGSALNISVGGEFVYESFRIRGGIAFIGSPYSNLIDKEEKVYSFGIGLRRDRFYLDAAFQKRSISGDYSPYTLENPARELSIVNNSNLTKVNVTLGYKI